jgi:hypothetical protein
MYGNKYAMSTAILIATVSNLSANEADFSNRFHGLKPAVSSLNGGLTVGYGYDDFHGFGYGNKVFSAASISAPIGQNFGLNVGINSRSGEEKYPGDPVSKSVYESTGVDAGLFWRNPEVGYIGVGAGYSRNLGTLSATYSFGPGQNFTSSTYSTNNTIILDINAATYFDRVTLSAHADQHYSTITYADGKYAPIYFKKKRISTTLEFGATYYLTDDFSLSAGINHYFDDSFKTTDGEIGATYMLPFASKNIAVSANGTFNHNYTGVNTSLHWYFGEYGKSLIARDRED